MNKNTENKQIVATLTINHYPPPPYFKKNSADTIKKAEKRYRKKNIFAI